MKKYSKICILLAVSALLGACKVDERYSLENIQDVDMDVTLFENGLEIPLIRNTVKLRADSLLNTAELPDSIMQYLKVGADGKYHISYSGAGSLDSLIDSFGLDSLLKIDAISFENSFDFQLGGLQEDKLKSPARDFTQELTLPDFSSVLDLSLDDVSMSHKTASGIAGFSYDIPADIATLSGTMSLCSKEDLSQLASAAISAGLTEVAIPLGSVSLSIDPFTIGAFTKPSKIKSVSSATLAPGARVAVTVSITPNILSSGTVTSAVSADMSEILTFEGGSGVLDLGSIALTPSNGYSATSYYPVTGLNASKLFSSKQITVEGSIAMDCAASASLAKNAGDDLRISVAIAFENFAIDSATCELEEFHAQLSEDVPVSIPEISLPSEVKGVDWVSFTDASCVNISIASENADKVPGLVLKANTLKFTFPSELQVSGTGVSGNVLSLSDVDALAGVGRKVNVSRITLPAASGGKISYSSNVKVEADCIAYGTVDLKDLRALSGSDISVVANVDSDITVADFSAKTNEISRSVDSGSGDASFDIPDAASTYGTFTITPQGSPKISIVTDIPDLGDIHPDAGDGIKVSLPRFIRFGSVAQDSGYSFDPATNVLTVKDIASRTIDLPVERIVISPVKSDSGYKVEGSYDVDGSVTIAPTTIGKSTLDKLSGAAMRFRASMPEIKAATIDLDSLSMSVDEKVVLKVSGFDSVPEFILEIGQVLLDDVNATLSLDLQGLPQIGGGKFIVDAEALMPDFVMPSVIPISGEIKDGSFIAAPVAIEGFDFSGKDIQKLVNDNDTYTDSIRIHGKIFAQNPSVDIRSLSSSIKGSLETSIADSDGKIGLQSLAARLDYQLDTLFSFEFPEFPELLSNVTLDLPTITAILGIGSNLGMPFSASASIVPVKNGVEDAANAISIDDLKFPYSADPAVKDTVTNTCELDLDPILNSKPDSIRVRLDARTDPSRFITFRTDADYTLNLGYDIDAPLELGDAFCIEICDTVDLDNASQYLEEYLPTTSCMIGGTVVNTMPVGVTVWMEFLSYDYNTESYKLVGLDPIYTEVVKPGEESEFSLKIGPYRDADIRGICAVRYVGKIISNGEPLSPESSIILKNVFLGLPNGLSINPDEGIL